MKYIISYDLGTGGTKSSLYDLEGRLLAAEFRSVTTRFPKDKFHEQRPDDWWNSVRDSVAALIKAAGVSPDDVLAVSGSGFSLGAVPVDEDGTLLTEFSPIWTDRRAESEANRVFETLDEPSWYMKTGNGFPGCQYAAFKMLWLKEHQPEIYGKTFRFLGTKDYVNLRLTGRMATDHSYASGSGVYDLVKRAYDPRLVEAIGIDARKLPEILESHDCLGSLTPEAAAILGLPVTVKVFAGGVDNACMAVGAACVSDGDMYTSLGTSAWIAVTSHTPLVNAEKRSYVFAHCVPGMFASATCIFSAGNSLRWVKNQLCADLSLQAEHEGRDVYDLMTEAALRSPPGARKLLFNPSMAGGSATEPSAAIRGAFLGLSLGHNRDDLLRAVLEGVAMNLRVSMDVLGEITPLSENMLLVGGGGKSAAWRQIFADIYGKNILETNVGQDAGSLGAMACAMVGLGLWNGYDRVQGVHTLRSVKRPNPENERLYARIKPVFMKAATELAQLGLDMEAME